MIGSLSVNSTDGDAQIIINKDGAATGEIRLMVTDHDNGDVAGIVVDLEDLRRIVNSEELSDA